MSLIELKNKVQPIKKLISAEKFQLSEVSFFNRYFLIFIIFLYILNNFIYYKYKIIKNNIKKGCEFYKCEIELINILLYKYIILHDVKNFWKINTISPCHQKTYLPQNFNQ